MWQHSALTAYLVIAAMAGPLCTLIGTVAIHNPLRHRPVLASGEIWGIPSAAMISVAFGLSLRVTDRITAMLLAVAYTACIFFAIFIGTIIGQYVRPALRGAPDAPEETPA